MKELHKLLKKLDACNEAIEWCEGKELTEAWETCERADWMMWLIGRMVGTNGWPTRQQIVLLACRFAEDALPFFEKKYPNNKSVRKCIEVTRQWANGEASIEEVRKARAAVGAADAAADAYAAYAAAGAAADAADAGAYAGAAAGAGAAAYAARSAKLKEYADIIRKELKIPGEVAPASAEPLGYAIVVTGEGAEARIATEVNLREQLHAVMCVCGMPWKECKTEGIVDAIETLDDPNNWGNDEYDKPFDIQILDGEISEIMVYRLIAKQSSPAPASAEPPQTGWVIEDEYGRLCLGMECSKLAWVTFTNENALSFARRIDAENAKTIWKFNGNVRDHSWWG